MSDRCFTGLTKETKGGYPVIQHVKRLIDGPIFRAAALTGAACSVFYRPYLRKYPVVPVCAVAMLASVGFLALLALPLNAPLGLKLLYRTVDAIWYAAGDTSADFNFYTKRATLAGVFSSTLLYWLNDRSEGNEATWAFLDRRIDDVMRFEKFKGQFVKKAARRG